MTIADLQRIFADFSDDMEVRVENSQEIADVIESSWQTDPNNESGRNYLVIIPDTE